MKRNRKRKNYCMLGFLIFVLAVLFSFNRNKAQAQEVETFLVTPSGELEDVSLDGGIQGQTDRNSVPVIEPILDEDDTLEKDLKNQKLDTSTTFYPEVLSSLQLSLKNFSQHFRKEAKGDTAVFDEIDVILENSDLAKAEIDSKFALLEKRGKAATFFFGPNYGAIKRLKIRLVDIENIAKQSNYLSEKVENEDFSAMLKAFSLQLLMQKKEQEETVAQFENKKSMFGWLIKIFY
ncbi:MAG: hypothetical protein ACD_8C00021G0003 [uncultured bacterium]|nr:MAG: hypothetical protein ACD_8C00021G0003 [uncultured bacterium]